MRLELTCWVLKTQLHGPHTSQVCRGCFYRAFEDEVHETIVGSGMFRRGDRVAVGVSGGKDSTVLAHVLTTLNARHEWVQCVRCCGVGTKHGIMDEGSSLR